jgi:hypothetical protein
MKPILLPDYEEINRMSALLMRPIEIHVSNRVSFMCQQIGEKAKKAENLAHGYCGFPNEKEYCRKALLYKENPAAYR